MSTAPDVLTEPLRLATLRNVFSVDLEDWHHLNCVDDTRYLLDALATAGVHATFFVLGKVAEREPALIRDIAAAGHEVATHGWSHTSLMLLTPDALRIELRRACALLQSLCGRRPFGFRAPCFSIVQETLWALDVLIDEGFVYDSSIFPFAGRRYGLPSFPRTLVRVRRSAGSLIEAPLSTVHACGRNWPVSGGGYFRLMPWRVIRRAIRTVNREHTPFVVYCHPYEFGPRILFHSARHTPFSWLGSRLDELKTNLFRPSMRRKFAALLHEGDFSSFAEVLPHEHA
jgi:polysaccharide deacetylase family protein (PEP-CTERM system associated)